MIRVGVIGLGFMGATHIAAYQATARAGFDCRLVAVADSKASRRAGELWDVGGNAVSDVSQRQRAFDPSIVRGYETAEQLIADSDVDLVSICTRTDTHVDLAARALRAGKHVLVEKPVSLCADEIRMLDQVATESGKICMPAMCMRFWPAWSWLKGRVDDGQFGKCLSAKFTRLAAMPRWSSFFADGAKSGGALVDLHIHDVDFVYWCFGRPTQVCSVGRLGDSSAIDHVTSAYRFAKPPFGSEPQGRKQAAAHVVAEGGWDHHDGFAFRMGYVAIFEDATADFDLTRDPQLLLCRDGKSEAVALENLSGYDVQTRHLLDAINQSTRTIATLTDAAAVAEILDAERESVLSGQPREIC
jgi:predicted dehydrogenase